MWWWHWTCVWWVCEVYNGRRVTFMFIFRNLCETKFRTVKSPYSFHLHNLNFPPQKVPYIQFVRDFVVVYVIKPKCVAGVPYNPFILDNEVTLCVCCLEQCNDCATRIFKSFFRFWLVRNGLKFFTLIRHVLRKIFHILKLYLATVTLRGVRDKRLSYQIEMFSRVIA